MLDTHRTGYEEAGGLMEIQWLPGITPDKNRLDKKRGAGVSPARFCLLFPRWKSRPAEHTSLKG